MQTLSVIGLLAYAIGLLAYAIFLNWVLSRHSRYIEQAMSNIDEAFRDLRDRLDKLDREGNYFVLDRPQGEKEHGSNPPAKPGALRM